LRDIDPDKQGREPDEQSTSGSGDAQPAGDGDAGTPGIPPPATWAGSQEAPDAREQEGDDFDSLEGPPDEELEELPDEDPEELPDEELEELPDEDLDRDAAAGVGEETIEADTPALADREAAREAALAGLRARTAELAAKRGATATVTAPAAATEDKAPAEPQPEEAPPAEAVPQPAGPEADEKPPGRGIWARFLAGSLLIVIAITTATSVSLLVYLKGIARGLGGLGRPVQSQLAVPDPGKPQTILILGSDKRPKGQEIGARSDTTILLRVAADQITVLSIPRDLKVNIPGHGIDKFNAAYTYGGPKLTLKVVKQLTGLDDINHVVNVDFTGFADAVNSIDCVYVDVDHHYYHSNVGLAPTDQYSEINIPAGYQRMCGLHALQYVRYRHDDNDLVRSARQQNFLREARQELPANKLIEDRSTLIAILKKYVTSDITDPTTLVSLGKLFLAARGAPVVQVHFPANLGGPNASYVTASEQAILRAVAQFEGQTPPPPSTSGQPSKSSGGSKSNGGSKKKSKAPQPPPPPLIDSSTLGQQYAAKLAGTKTKSGKPMLDVPVYYPTKLAPGSTITGDSRAFPIDGPGNDVFHGYKLVAAMPTNGYTAYYGVSGTDWRDPPILANPDETKTIDGRDYLESWDGPQLRLVAWKTAHGSYWLDNTLLNALTPGQMLGIAQSLRKLTG
jgi:polyisoprenyl-teichoic acid--peptidoglycan teichoic acid transferase